jgi:hypothetical protein
MKIKSEKLLLDLAERTHQNIKRAELLKDKTDEALNLKKSVESWSVLECLEHLNLYGNFYLPEIDLRIDVTPLQNELFFKSGLIGNYFAQSMLPKPKLNKMKTFKNMNPLNSKLDRIVIDVFIRQQHQILYLLKRAEEVSLNKTKISISISRFIKLKLGDTFRFLIYHNQRHLDQAERI